MTRIKIESKINAGGKWYRAQDDKVCVLRWHDTEDEARYALMETRGVKPLSHGEALVATASGPFSFVDTDGNRLVVAADDTGRALYWLWTGELCPSLALADWKAAHGEGLAQ